MQKKRTGIKLKKALKTTAVLGAVIALLISGLIAAGVFDKVELKILTTAFQKRKPIEKRRDIITIDIDDNAVSKIDRWPWSWDKHALLLDLLTMYGARTVAFMDMDFSKELPFGFPMRTVEDYKTVLHTMAAGAGGPDRILSVLPDFNKDFYGSLRKNGEACFTVDFKIPEAAGGKQSVLQLAETNAALHTEQKAEGIRLLKERIGTAGKAGDFRISTDVVPLLPDILKYSSCAGFNTVTRDADGIVHKYPLMAHYRGSLYPSIGLQLARKFLEASEVKIKDGEYVELRSKERQVRIPVTRQGEMYINWAGDYSDSFVHLPFDMVALFIGYQMAKDELAGHSQEELAGNPMGIGQVLMQRLAGSRLVPGDLGNDISAVTVVSALVEHRMAKGSYRSAEEILSAIGIVDPKDETFLGIARLTYFNNWLLKQYKASGKIPAFEDAVKGDVAPMTKETEPRFRDSYDMMVYCIEHNLVGKVRPLYFPRARVSVGGKKEFTITPLFFRDKIVFYGLTATGLAVRTASPFHILHDMLDMVPNVVNTILTGQFIREAHPAAKYLISYAYILVLVLCVLLLSPLAGLALVCIIAGAHLGAAWLSFSGKGCILPVSPPLSALFSSYLTAVVYRYFQELRERRKVRSMFSTMVSPEVLRMVEENPERLSIAGEKREATLFSSDVSGFTTISEGVTARELANILNIYLTPMSNIIMSYNGYIDKYEGDAIKADFGVPLDDPDHSWKACFSALYQQEELKVIQRMIFLKYGVKITARMGINTGTVSAGNMGSERRMQYTVMGDAVTLAEELEPANKVFGTWIAIGPATYEQAGDFIEARYLGTLAVGASGHPAPVYELAGWNKEKFLACWADKPIPELVLESMRRMLPEKVLAYHEFYAGRRLPESRLLGELTDLFAGLRGPAVEYMKVNNIRSVLFVREELARLRRDLDGRGERPGGMPDALRAEIEALQREIPAQAEPWRRVLLEWKRELKECAALRLMLTGKIAKEENDHYLNAIDTLEKSAECIHKRIAFATHDDPAAMEMAEHLKGLAAGEGLPGQADTGLLAERSLALENEIDSRLSSFADGLKDRTAEFHALISDFCVIPEQKRRAIGLFGEGRELYLKREWDGAIEKFREALAIAPDDGPSMVFIKKIEELRKYPPGGDWDGTWKE